MALRPLAAPARADAGRRPRRLRPQGPPLPRRLRAAAAVAADQPRRASGQRTSYDLVLVGSDEVWNLRHPWYGGAPLFYGVGAPGRRLAAYAASFGNQPATDRLDAGRAALLRRFEAISVRDDNSRALVRAALGRDPDARPRPLPAVPAGTNCPDR